MSTVSGLASKSGESKSKQKYSALNINTIYKGKSIENPKTSITPKHGLQSLGKVGAGRRMPPPANLPSLKSQNAGSNSNINLVPSGGQGWGSGREEESGSTTNSQTLSGQVETAPQKLTHQQTNQQPSPIPVSNVPVASANVVVSGTATTIPTVSSGAAIKTWSNVTAPEDGGPEKSFLAHQSPFFPQEFPKLAGGNVQQDLTLKQNVDISYGPGPSLRPQTEGSWGRGTLQQPGFAQGNPPANSGSGVNEQQTMSPPLQESPGQVGSRGNYPPPIGVMPSQSTRPPMTTNMQVPGAATNMMPQQQLAGIPPQYRMMPPYIYGRGYPPAVYPLPQNFPHPNQGSLHQIPRQPYYPDGRIRAGLARPLDEENQRSSTAVPAPPILSDRDMEKFDEILGSEIHDGWATANTEIDYNAKLVFSDGEDDGPSEAIDKTDRKQKDWNYEKEERNKKYQRNSDWQHCQTSNSRINYDYQASYQRQPSHGNYASQNRGGRADLADEDEMWRQKSKQSSDEMQAAVVRARLRREVEENKYEMSRQAAHEKLKVLEKVALEKEKSDKETYDMDARSRHSSESRDDKPQRASGYPTGSFPNKQFKHIPPRFQKQAEMMRQQQQQQNVHSFERYATSQRNYVQEEQQFSSLQNYPQQQRVQMTSNQANQQLNKNPTPEATRLDNIGSEGAGDPRWTPEYDPKPKREERSKQIYESNWRSHRNTRSPQSDYNKPMRENFSDNYETERYRLLCSSDSSQPSRLENRDIKSQDNVKEITDKKTNLIERQESTSSQSDKRSSSSREEKFKKLDWASETDNVPLSYTKKDWQRHLPVNQRPIEVEQVKKNSLHLKKNISETVSGGCGDVIGQENKEIKDEVKKEHSTQHIEPLLNENIKSDSTKIVNDTHKNIEKDSTEFNKRINKENYDKPREKDRGDSRNERSGRRNMNRYSDYYGYPSPSLSSSAYRGSRGREYRRSRGSNEKQPQYDTKGKGSDFLRGKSRSDKKDVRSDENKPKELEETKSSATKSESTQETNSGKNENDNFREKTSEQTSNFVNLPSNASRRGRGAVFRNARGVSRSYGPSNYGPPPLRAAFGDGTSKSQSSSFNRNLNEPQTSNEAIKESTRNQKEEKSFRNDQGKYEKSLVSTSSNGTNTKLVEKINANQTRRSGYNSGGNHRSEPLAPRFQKRHSNYPNRGGQGKNWNDRPTRSGMSLESENANDEWETASESSDVNERGDRRSSRRNELRGDSKRLGNRRGENKRNDYSRAQSYGSNYNSSQRTRNRNEAGIGSGSRGAASGSGSNQQRNGTLPGSSNNENMTVCSLSDVTLDNPSAIDLAISDAKQRSKNLSDDDHLIASEGDNGFQTVSYKKRNKILEETKSKKIKSSDINTKQSEPRTISRHNKLPPRLAKQRENLRMNKTNDLLPSANNLANSIKSLSLENNQINVKENESSVLNAWSRPLSHSLQSTTENPAITTMAKTVMKPSNFHEVQALSVSSKSSSFDQHDSGVDVNDQLPSTASSQRSSPSNDDNKITTGKINTLTNFKEQTNESEIEASKPMGTVIFENPKFKKENAALSRTTDKMNKEISCINEEISANVIIESSKSVPSPIGTSKLNKNEASIANVKIDYSLPEKTHPTTSSSKVASFGRSAGQTVQSPSADDLNLKIQSVKKVWDAPSTTPTIEHTPEDAKGGLLNSFEESKMKTRTSNSGQNRVSPLNTTSGGMQMNQSRSKQEFANIDAFKAKSHGMSLVHPNQTIALSQSMPAHQAIIQSQQMMMNPMNTRQLESMRSLSGVPTNIQMAGMPAISSPPTMIYNTATPQQVAAHIYQAFNPQIDAMHQNQMRVVGSMAQFSAQNATAAYGQQHLLPQANPMGHGNMFMTNHNQPQSAADQYRVNPVAAHAHQQATLATSLLKSQFVHQQNAALHHNLSTTTWTAPGQGQINPQTGNYYQQASAMSANLHQQQQYNMFRSKKY